MGFYPIKMCTDTDRNRLCKLHSLLRPVSVYMYTFIYFANTFSPCLGLFVFSAHYRLLMSGNNMAIN